MKKSLLWLALFFFHGVLLGRIHGQEIITRSPKAEQRTQEKLNGKVRLDTGGTPVSGATVRIIELGLYTKSDEKGNFTFGAIPAGKYTILVQHLGMLDQEKEISFPFGEVIVSLKENSIALQDVVVVGKERRSAGATSTVINRMAIEHMQATNLGEVLQLLPGSTVSNPDFTNTNKASIRQYSSDDMSSLGTSVIVNGAPLSNDANLQAMNTATSGVLAGFSTSSGMGLDMRSLSADNIETVEVIRGIPSVAYGDLTAGGILVTTKAGKEPLQIKARLNPKLTQFWVGQGFALGPEKGALFVDLDFTKAYDKQISAYASYERLTGSVQYTRTFGQIKPLYSNTYFSFGANLDSRKVDPDYEAEQIIQRAQNYAYRLSTTGKWTLNRRFARNLNYTLSAQLSLQKGYQQQLNTLSVSAVSMATENTTQTVPYLPSTFLNQLWIEGKPLHVFAKVSDDFYLKAGAGVHSILIGTDYRLDANYGAGKTMNPNNPYRTASSLGFRPRAFKDIPALNQMGAYIEDRYSRKFNDRDFRIQAGLRFDYMQAFSEKAKTVWSPRVNASLEVMDNLTVRGGYGITAKSPTLLYLYPENAYYDAFSLNHYKEQPEEALAIMTTRVFNTENPDLKVAKTTKREVGVDWMLGKRRLSITGYDEKTVNGYDMTTNLNSVKFVSIPIYTVVSAPAGQPPVLSPEVTQELRTVTYSAPSNGLEIENKGIEFDFDLGRFDRIRTSFLLNGAYVSTRSMSTDPYILIQHVANQPLTRIGVFEARGRKQERMVTTIRAIHNIPELRFIVSLSAQTIWKDQDRYLHYSRIPIGYIPVGAAGTAPYMVAFTEAERNAITEADRDLYLSLSDGYFKTERWKPLWLFNIKLTKEFAKNMGFSFFANNVFNHRPLEASTRYPEQFTRRNISMFYGTEISLKF